VDEAPAVALSENTSIALLSDQRACVIDSYELQVVCGDRQWRNPESYGGEGEGPGEFRRPARLMRLGPDRLGVVDIALERLTILPGTETVRIPTLFRPLARVEGDTIIGVYETFSRDRTTSYVAWLSLPADSVLARATFRYQPPDDWPVIPFFIGGTVLGDGDLVFNVSNRAVVRYRMDGTLIQEFQITERDPVYPDEEEVRRHADEYRRIFGQSPTPQELEKFAETPEAPLLPMSPVLIGPGGLVFVGSSRDREARSYIDVFRDGRQAGTLRVRDRLLSFDILGDVLATLVERTGQIDEEGLTPRGIDWYKIEVR